jgi:MOSC domain-containing protein YiiM
MRLLSVNLAVVRTGEWTGRMGRSGMDKRPAAGPVRAGRLGMAGDTVCDRKAHGGPHRAAYAYADEDARWWAAELRRAVRPGNFGENLTTSGLDVTGSLIGERWAIGSAVFEVSTPRLPCRVFAGFWNIPDLIRRFIEHGCPGAYLRVVVEGHVTAGDPIAVVHRPDHGVTLGETFAALTTRPELLPRLDAVLDLLPPPIQETVGRRTAGQP